ncbi:MAG TPA: CsbD family protein [Candidatus Manganitrophaceae bacterium]|nr:CsbD family protein [Candidatus Manganitrophaceae bacterium]
MNKDQIKGRVKEAVGNIKENAGKALGDKKLQGKGMAEKTAGKVQAGYGDVKDKAEKKIKEAEEETEIEEEEAGNM